MKYMPLIGRLLFALTFLAAGLNQLFNSTAMAPWVTSKGLPVAQFLIIATGLMLIFGGLSVAFGFLTRIGAWTIFGFLLPVTFIMHNPIGLEGVQQQIEMTNFVKNIGLMGMSLVIAYYGAGPYSVDRKYFPQMEAHKTFEETLYDSNPKFAQAFRDEMAHLGQTERDKVRQVEDVMS